MRHTIIRAALLALAALTAGLSACSGSAVWRAEEPVPTPGFVITTEQTHTKFSSAIPPALRVPSGAVIEAFTHEATGGQLDLNSTAADIEALDWDRIHTLTGPISIEGAQPGDVLAVTLLELEVGDWGWTMVSPDFGFLGAEQRETAIKTYAIEKGARSVEFAPGVRVPLNPFPGVMAVAPATREMLSTIPPRENGGNLDDPHITAGTTVYFPIFVDGALFSIGDTHAAQALGEVGGSAIEAPMRIVFRVEVLKNARPIPEPQYETADYYATTGFATTIDEAARKATRYMLDYLEAEHGMSRTEAYMLCSLVGDLKIAEVVDEPHMLVAMHIRKDALAEREKRRD